MDYGYILGKGWSLVWRNRFIWILGFVMALGGGTVGLSGSFNLSLPTPTSPPQELDPVTNAELERAIEAIESGNIEPFLNVLPLVLGTSLAAIVFFIIAVAIIFLLLWLISLIARAGVIAAVDQSNQGLQPTLGSVLGAGIRSLLRVIGMKMILALPFVLIGILALASIGGSIWAIYQYVITGNTSSLSVLGAVPLLLGIFCFAFPLSVFFQIIDASAYRGIVIQNMGVFRAIGHGFEFFFRHFVEILVLGGIFVVVGILFSIALTTVFIPIQMFWSFLLSTVGGGVWTYAASMAWLILSVVMVALISALLVAWQSTTFSLAYLDFIGRNQQYGSYAPPVAGPTIWKTP